MVRKLLQMSGGNESDSWNILITSLVRVILLVNSISLDWKSIREQWTDSDKSHPGRINPDLQLYKWGQYDPSGIYKKMQNHKIFQILSNSQEDHSFSLIRVLYRETCTLKITIMKKLKNHLQAWSNVFCLGTIQSPVQQHSDIYSGISTSSSLTSQTPQHCNSWPHT